MEWPDVVYDKVGNILLSRIMGADVRLSGAGFDIAFRRAGRRHSPPSSRQEGSRTPFPPGLRTIRSAGSDSRAGPRRLREGAADVGSDRPIARQTAGAIGLDRELADEEIVLLDEWHAGTYGIPDAKTIEAIRLCARLEGMLTDPVYEGKSMAALIDLVRDGRIASGSRVLYAHLGGQPALNAYAGAF